MHVFLCDASNGGQGPTPTGCAATRDRRCTDEVFIDVGSIQVRGVVEVDAELQRPQQHRPRILLARSVRLGGVEPCKGTAVVITGPCGWLPTERHWFGCSMHVGALMQRALRTEHRYHVLTKYPRRLPSLIRPAAHDHSGRRWERGGTADKRASLFLQALLCATKASLGAARVIGTKH